MDEEIFMKSKPDWVPTILADPSKRFEAMPDWLSGRMRLFWGVGSALKMVLSCVQNLYHAMDWRQG